uniref:Uncharacterized protein n=1 Tax=Arundo donax TaxID=35708 RepID=A0A0A9AQI9_ARUDO
MAGRAIALSCDLDFGDQDQLQLVFTSFLYCTICLPLHCF